MNRYKKELQLRGFSNLPTMKTLETKQGKHIITIDEYNKVTSVKTCLAYIMNKSSRKHRNVCKIIRHSNWSVNGEVKRTMQDEKVLPCIHAKLINDYIKHLRKINKPNTVHMMISDNLVNNEIVKEPMLMTMTIDIVTNNQKRTFVL